MSHDTPDDDSTRVPPAAGPLRVTGVLPWRDGGWRSPMDLLALAGTVGALWLVADTTGAVAGGALVVSYFLLPPVAVFAAGTVVATALVPAGSAPVLLAIPVAPLAVLLLTTPAGSTGGSRLRHAVVLAGVGLVLGGVAVLTLVLTGAPWLAGLALSLAAAAGYVSVDLMTLSTVEASDA
jgi:hypothetical protein